MYVPVSLSFSLNIHLQKRFGSRSDPNGIQERMFRQFKNLRMRQKVCSVVQKPMRTIKWVFNKCIHCPVPCADPEPPPP